MASTLAITGSETIDNFVASVKTNLRAALYYKVIFIYAFILELNDTCGIQNVN